MTAAGIRIQRVFFRTGTHIAIPRVEFIYYVHHLKLKKECIIKYTFSHLSVQHLYGFTELINFDG